MLLEECDLRGFKIGGAQYSEKHCNFIINQGNATSKDIEDLIYEGFRRVKDKFGIELRTEIKIIGNNPKYLI
jgi:UDP-N-acetylmuramate dehydrogenase